MVSYRDTQYLRNASRLYLQSNIGAESETYSSGDYDFFGSKIKAKDFFGATSILGMEPLLT